MFTSFKFDPAAVAGMVQSMRAGFAASGKPGTFEDNALRVIGERMRAHPARYVEFGPYWWAVKAALRDAGYALGDLGDPLVLAEYRGAGAAETLVMAEAFKDLYRATWVVGTAAFDLVGDGELYELFDADMAARARR